MASQGINQYLKFRAFGQHQYLNSGVIKPIISNGEVRFINTLTDKDFGSFDDAAFEARSFGLTNIQVGDSPASRPTSTVEQLDRRAKSLLGSDASVKVLEFKIDTKAQLERITRDVLKTVDASQIMFQNGETVRFLTLSRGVGVNTRFEDPSKVLEIARGMGLHLEGELKRSKRANTFFSHKQMSFDPKFGSIKIGLFDALDVYGGVTGGTDVGPKAQQRIEFFEMLGWDRFKSQAQNAVTGRYGNNPAAMQAEMIRALRYEKGAVKKIAETKFGRSFGTSKDLFRFLQAPGRASDVQDLLISVTERNMVERSLDGKSFIRRSLVENLRKDVAKQLRDEFGLDVGTADLSKVESLGITGTRGKGLLRYYEDISKALKYGGEFNLRASGVQFVDGVLDFDAVKYLRSQDDRTPVDEAILHQRGNVMVMDDLQMNKYASDLDILSPTLNVNFGSPEKHVGYRVASEIDASRTGVLTAELNASKPVAYADVQSVALGDDVITRKQSDAFFREVADAKRELERVVRETNAGKTAMLRPDNRAFSIIKDSIESSIISGNPEAAEHSSQMLRRLAEGTLPANELPVLIKRFGESLMRSRNGKSSPRVMLPDTIRAYASTSSTESIRTGGTSKILNPGEFTVDEAGRIIFPDADMALRYPAGGGPDLDDAFNIAMRTDGEDFIGIMYRQPNTSDEVSQITMRNVHRSRALKNILGKRSPDFANQLHLLESVSQQVFDEMRRADHTTRLDDIYGIVQNAEYRKHEGASATKLKLRQEEADSLRRAIGAGDAEEARRLLDEDITTRLMYDNVGKLERLTEDIVSRAGVGTRLPETDEFGITRFPGTTRTIGKGDARREIEFSFEQLGRGAKKLDANSMQMLVQELENPGLLGRWVNSKTSLGVLLQINKDAFANITDKTKADEVAALLENKIKEEEIIDAIIQGEQITPQEIEHANEVIKANWEEQARLALKYEDIKMDDYFIENMPDSDLKRRIMMDPDRNLAESMVGRNYRIAKKFQENIMDFAEDAKIKSFDIQVSKDVADYAEAIEQELVDIKRMTGLSSDEIKGFQQLTLERRIFGSFEAGVFGQRSAELFAAISRGQFSGLLSSTIEAAGMDIQGVGSGEVAGETLDTYARRIGRYVAPTEEFRMRIKDLGFDLQTLDDMGERALGMADEAGDLIEHRVEDAMYLFDRQGRILPQSMVPVGDGTYEQLGSIATARTQMEYARAQDVGATAVDLRETAARLSRSASQAVGEMPAVEAATSTPRPAFEAASRGANLKRGGMIQELLGHLSPRTRAIGVAAAAAVGASMIYNSVRDREYTKDKIGPPQTVDDPYHQDLALSPANAARVSQQFGTTYDIRTRGGNFGDDFLQTLADFTGGDVYASAYRDPYSDMTLEQTVGGSYR